MELAAIVIEYSKDTSLRWDDEFMPLHEAAEEKRVELRSRYADDKQPKMRKQAMNETNIRNFGANGK